MRIQHNISAMNANRQLGINNDNLSKNLQKLSSGYKINSAADDAAGLAISEKMRSQIRGLDQAANNANDGISLVQTAEGALNETTSILQRMKELATQSSNGTYQDDVDRDNIQMEVDALKSEIDRISTSTNFNKNNLLDGSINGSSSGLTITNVKASTAASTISSTETFTFNSVPADGQTISVQGIDFVVGTDVTGTTTDELANSLKTAISGSTATVTAVADGNSIILTSGTAGASGTLDGTELTSTDAAALSAPIITDGYDQGDTIPASTTLSFTDNKLGDGNIFVIDGTTYELDKGDGVKAGHTAVNMSTATPNTDGKYTGAAIASALNTALGGSETVTGGSITLDGTHKASAGGVTFQIGDSSAADQQVTLDVSDMSTAGLGLSTISLTSQSDAHDALDVISDAINQVSTTRANLGALLNRLEHTVNNLGVTSENLTSAESRIRDVDMASEMMDMTKNQVLAQAAQSMLAQANTQPQSVLKLLQ